MNFLAVFVLVVSTALQSASKPASRPTSQPATEPTSRPTFGVRSIVTYPFPAQSDYHKLIAPITRKYGFPAGAETFHDLRAMVVTPKGELHPARVDNPVRKLDPNNATYTLFVPDTVTNDDPTVGLIVFLSPGEGIVSDIYRMWREPLAKHKLIFIAPHNVENGTHSIWRVFMAIEAVRNIKRDYPNLDRDRIYISGMSGGGRISSHTAQFFPDVFAGCFAMCGCNFYRDTPVPNGKPGEIWPGFWPSPDQNILKKVRTDSRLLLFTGSNDYNRDSTRAFVDMFKNDKFEHVIYLEEPGLGHALPNGEFFEKGLQALDQPLFDGAADLYTRAIDLEKKRKLGEALLAFESAARHGGENSFVKEATVRASTLRAKFDAHVASIEKSIAAKQLDQAASRVRDMRTEFGLFAADRATEFSEQIKRARVGTTSRPASRPTSRSIK